MTGTDHFNEILRLAENIASGFPEHMRTQAKLNFLTGSAIETATELIMADDLAGAFDVITAASRSQTALAAKILEDPEAAETLAKISRRAQGEDVEIIPPPHVPVIVPIEGEMAWAIAMIEESDPKPERGHVIVAPVAPTCCFGGCPSACAGALAKTITFVGAEGFTTAEYCEPHAQVILKAIEVWRERVDATSESKSDAPASEG